MARRKPLLGKEGSALVLTLYLLLLVSVIAVTTGYLRFQSSLAARQMGLSNLADSQLTALRTVVDAGMLEVAHQVRQRAEARLRGTAPFLTNQDLAGLLADAQGVADQAFCTISSSENNIEARVRLHFTARACGQDLPPGTALGAVQRVLATGLAAVYDLPFLLVLEGERVGEVRRRRVLPGRLRLLVGNPPPSFFQLFLLSNYAADGTPQPFLGYQVWDGPVYVAGAPVFGRTYSGPQAGPVFLDGFSTARCLGVSGSACPGGTGGVQFVDVGAVLPERIYPSPFAPCYGPSCPKLSGGVDWNAPVRSLPLVERAPLAVDGPAQAYLQAGRVGNQQVTRLTLFRAGREPLSYALTQTANPSATVGPWARTDAGLGLLAEANRNLLSAALEDISLWSSTCGRVSISGNTLVLGCRDTYYGFLSPIAGQYTWEISFEAKTTEALGAVQVGFQTYNPATGRYCWFGTGNLAGARVPQGRDWTRVSATVTLPSSWGACTPIGYIRPWIQIDDNPPHSGAGTAYVRNVSIRPGGAMGNHVLFLSGIPQLEVRGRLEVSGPTDGVAYLVDPGLTLVATDDVVIRGNLFSSAPPCLDPAGFDRDGSPVPGNCSQGGGSGVLALVSRGGDVVVDAPHETKVHAVVAALQGAFRYGSSQRGDVFLQGGVLAQNLGPFGGYRLKVAYDPRLRGMVPFGFNRLPLGVYGVYPLYSWQEGR